MTTATEPGSRRPRLAGASLQAHVEDLAALDRMGALLAQPEAFRAWLEALPPDQALTPAGIDDRWYWIDPHENPIGRWLKAETRQAVWFHRTTRRQYRLLISHTWRDTPVWVGRFLEACGGGFALAAQSRDAAYPQAPTAGQALAVLRRALTVDGGAAE